MVPLVLLTIDIVSKNPNISEEEFRESVDPCLNRLRDLKGSFDRRTDIHADLRYLVSDDGCKYLGARIVLAISVGKERSQHLLQVYSAYAKLISFELPDCDIDASSQILKFDYADQPRIKKP